MSTSIVQSQESLKQPRALYLLFFVQMWECFSYYGMRALLVLYMINKLGFSDLQAYGIYALYCSLSELGGIAGGYLADKFLGLRSTIFLGGWIMALGHFSMAMEGFHLVFFYLGLSLIIIGSCLFSTNISALLGEYYEGDDPRREEGFTLFYVGINIGALLASLICGIIGEVYGWHYGFGLAAFGMLLGNFALYGFRGILQGKGTRPEASQSHQRNLSYFGIALMVPLCIVVLLWESTIVAFLPFLCIGCLCFIGWKLMQTKMFAMSQLVILGIALLSLAIFYSAEEQIGSSFMVLSERYADRLFLGFEIPNSILLSFNPLTVILGGTLLSRLMKHSSKGMMVMRMAAGLFLAAVVFAIIAAFCFFPGEGGKISIVVLLVGTIFISIAELLIGPTAYAYCSEIAPPSLKGVTMGLVPLGFSLAELIGGVWSKMMALEEGEEILPSLALYGEGFGNIAVALSVVSVGIAVVMFFLKRGQPAEALTLGAES